MGHRVHRSGARPRHDGRRSHAHGAVRRQADARTAASGRGWDGLSVPFDGEGCVACAAGHAPLRTGGQPAAGSDGRAVSAQRVRRGGAAAGRRRPRGQTDRRRHAG